MWLLEELGNGARLEPLIGDLAEQFDTGRSRVWYWRQAMGALLLDVARTVRAHGLSFLAAVLVGCALTSFWHLANGFALHSVEVSLGSNRYPALTAALLRFTGLLLESASLAALSFASAWLVTRIHGAHRRLVLLAFVAALTALRLPEIAALLIDGLASSRLSPLLIPELLKAALQAICILVSGLWVLRIQRFAEMNRRTRLVALLVLAQVLLYTTLYDAWRAGALHYAAWGRYALDAIEIASAAYLALLLWRSGAAAVRTGRSA
jgi:hypothetical protein